MGPTIHLVRHAQGVHNLSRQNEMIPDPLLTDLGSEQCASLRSQFPFHGQVTRLFSSPLRRALYTCLWAFGKIPDDPASAHSGKVVALPEFQEFSDFPCDTGSDRAVLEKEFAGIADFSYLEPEWHRKAAWVSWEVKLRELTARADRARQILKEVLRDAGDDEHIVLVSHGAFLHFVTQDFSGIPIGKATGWENTEFRSYELIDGTEDGAHLALVETEQSWQLRNGSKPKPTIEEQEKLRDVYYQTIEQLITP